MRRPLMWPTPVRVRPAAEDPPCLLGNSAYKYFVLALALAYHALDWGLVHGAPEHARDFGCLRTEVACLVTAGALSLCVGLMTLWLQRLAMSMDRLELHRLVVAGRLRHKEHQTLRGGLAVANGSSARWLGLYQYTVLFLFAVAIARFLYVGRCSEDGIPMLLLLYESALWILYQDGQSETLLAPLATMGIKWATGLRDPAEPGVICVGFMERSSLPYATLQGLHTGFCAMLAPGLPEYAQLTAAGYMLLGTVEHWLRHWDAVAAHKTLLASGEAGVLRGLLLGNGDTVSLAEGALLSMLLYLTSGIAASGLWLYTRHLAEMALVQQALEDTEPAEGWHSAGSE